MNLATLSSNMSLEALYDDIFYTIVQLRAAPPAAGLVPDWEKLLLVWSGTLSKERSLREAGLQAQANLVQCDRVLDRLVDRLDNTLGAVAGGGREAPLYQRYFGALSPSKLKKPTLGKQLLTMRGWVTSLKAASQPELVALSSEVDKAVTAAEQAQAAQSAAGARLRDFRQVGDRKVLFDQTNALRQRTFAALGTMALTSPTDHLPPDYAEGFFRKGLWQRLEPEAAVAELTQEIAEAQASLAELQQQLAEQQALVAAQAQAAKERAEAEAQLAAARDKLKAQAAEVAELEKKEKRLAKPKRRPTPKK